MITQSSNHQRHILFDFSTVLYQPRLCKNVASSVSFLNASFSISVQEFSHTQSQIMQLKRIKYVQNSIFIFWNILVKLIGSGRGGVWKIRIKGDGALALNQWLTGVSMIATKEKSNCVDPHHNQVGVGGS